MQEFIKVTKENFDERIKQANIASKNDIADFVKKTYFDKKNLLNINKKVTLNSTRHLEAKKFQMTYQKMIYKSEKVCDFLLDRMYFTRNDGYIFF